MAAVIAKEVICPRCGNVGTNVEIPLKLPPKVGSRWVWPPRKKKDEPGEAETTFDMRQYRCVACAGLEVMQRAFDHANPKPDDAKPGQLFWGDATFFRAVPRHQP